MKCEFDYCVYNQDTKCCLDEVRINSAGMCEECTMVLLDDETLKKNKSNQLQGLTEKRGRHARPYGNSHRHGV